MVSTNWQEDYSTKARDYEALGIREFGKVDYAALGGRRFIGNPKQPTFSVYEPIEGECEVRQLRGRDRIASLTFPELNLTAEQVFRAGNSASNKKFSQQQSARIAMILALKVPQSLLYG